MKLYIHLKAKPPLNINSQNHRHRHITSSLLHVITSSIERRDARPPLDAAMIQHSQSKSLLRFLFHSHLVNSTRSHAVLNATVLEPIRQLLVDAHLFIGCRIWSLLLFSVRLGTFANIGIVFDAHLFIG